MRRPSQRSKSPTIRTLRAFGAQTAKLTPSTPSCVRGCAPSTSYRRSCVPSPMRCRSTSPSVGPNRYGSSQLPRVAVGEARSGRGSRTGRAPGRGRSPPTGRGRSAPSARVPPFGATRSAALASGWKARTTVPPSAWCAPRMACGSWCSPRARRASSGSGAASVEVVIGLTIRASAPTVHARTVRLNDSPGGRSRRERHPARRSPAGAGRPARASAAPPPSRRGVRAWRRRRARARRLRPRCVAAMPACGQRKLDARSASSAVHVPSRSASGTRATRRSWLPSTGTGSACRPRVRRVDRLGRHAERSRAPEPRMKADARRHRPVGAIRRAGSQQVRVEPSTVDRARRPRTATASRRRRP